MIGVGFRARVVPSIVIPVLGFVLLMTALVSDVALAQQQRGLSMNDLALDWLRGNYASPVVCKIDETVHRGLRRILIEKGPSNVSPAIDLVSFVDLEVDDAERCFTEIGGATPNIIGELKIRHPSSRPRDTAMRDFKVALKRERGFELDIISGKLEIREVGPEVPPAESVDFRGGNLRLHHLREGSDDLRLLKDLPSPRHALLEIETRKGRKFSFPVSLSKPKPAAQHKPYR